MPDMARQARAVRTGRRRSGLRLATSDRPRVVVIGAGFAGHTAARGLLRRLGAAAEVVVVNATTTSSTCRCCPR